MSKIELPDDQRWIVNFKEKHAVDRDGNHWSYVPKTRKPHRCKLSRRENVPWVCIFDEDQPKLYRLIDVMAQCWFPHSLGCYLIDSNPRNVALTNLVPLWEQSPEGEIWVSGYEGMYSVDSNNIYSYKKNVRKILKPSSQSKVTLYSKDGARRTHSVASLLKKKVSH